MARKKPLSQTEAEELIALLEAIPNGRVLGVPALEMAAELRRTYGICTYQDENEYHRKNRIGRDGAPRGDC